MDVADEDSLEQKLAIYFFFTASAMFPVNFMVRFPLVSNNFLGYFESQDLFSFVAVFFITGSDDRAWVLHGSVPRKEFKPTVSK